MLSCVCMSFISFFFFFYSCVVYMYVVLSLRERRKYSCDSRVTLYPLGPPALLQLSAYVVLKRRTTTNDNDDNNGGHEDRSCLIVRTTLEKLCSFCAEKGNAPGPISRLLVLKEREENATLQLFSKNVIIRVLLFVSQFTDVTCDTLQQTETRRFRFKRFFSSFLFFFLFSLARGLCGTGRRISSLLLAYNSTSACIYVLVNP